MLTEINATTMTAAKSDCHVLMNFKRKKKLPEDSTMRSEMLKCIFFTVNLDLQSLIKRIVNNHVC